MDEFIELLESAIPGVDFRNEETLIDDEIITSFDIVLIVAKISEKYGIEFPVKDIVPENFNSAKSLFELVNTLKK